MSRAQHVFRQLRAAELVGLEEIAHVRFGVRWFVELTGDLTFDAWSAALLPPISPMLVRGHPLQRAARELGMRGPADRPGQALRGYVSNEGSLPKD